ncbi:MAG TPA: tetratricopeptide repeat protein [Steroidobacteraceae bacterium]|nr:tetratricopeptide repeat protein [Steroidobacteraceae bacterium]
MRKPLLAAAAFVLGATFALGSPSFAQAADPTMNQVYEAAAAGHLDQAQQMITQVLEHHPNSAKAHYVQAELFAKQGKTALARAELGSAERLNPGLTEFSAHSVQELKGQLGLISGGRSVSPRIVSEPRPAPHVPWGGLLLGLVVVAVLIALFRRRPPSVAQFPTAGPGVGGAPPGYGQTGYGPGYGPAPMGGGGMGSGIAGGLASGLAVGAGVVAGEELAHHFMDGGRREGGVIPSAEAAEPGQSNSDMGGNDFGANDPGSWDDGGGGMGGGGGDDWS